MKNKKTITEIAEASKEAPVVVVISASWCGPCRAFAPIFAEVANDSNLAEIYTLVKIDVDECHDLCVEYEVDSVPCTFVFKGGVPVKRRSGTFPNAKLFMEWIAEQILEQAIFI